MADQPLSRERTQSVAYAIRDGQPYDASEAADLLDFIAAEIGSREATVRNAVTLITKGKYRAARSLLAKISGQGS